MSYEQKKYLAALGIDEWVVRDLGVFHVLPPELERDAYGLPEVNQFERYEVVSTVGDISNSSCIIFLVTQEECCPWFVTMVQNLFPKYYGELWKVEDSTLPQNALSEIQQKYSKLILLKSTKCNIVKLDKQLEDVCVSEISLPNAGVMHEIKKQVMLDVFRLSDYAFGHE